MKSQKGVKSIGKAAIFGQRVVCFVYTSHIISLRHTRIYRVLEQQQQQKVHTFRGKCEAGGEYSTCESQLVLGLEESPGCLPLLGGANIPSVTDRERTGT